MSQERRGVGGGRRPPPGLVDAHAHLTDERFGDELDAVIERASSAGITRILTCGEDVASSEAAVALARRSPVIRAAVGIHPHRAASCDERSLGRIRALASDPAVVAIGEIGIDLSGRSAPEPDQRRALTAQLALANELGLPVCLHVRDAGAVVRGLLGAMTRPWGYVHCYSEGPAEVGLWVDLGLSISFAGPVTYPRNDALRAAAAVVPPDRLLLETDAPYLAPQDRRGQRNEPALIVSTYGHVARTRGVSAPELVAQVSRNASALFGTRW